MPIYNGLSTKNKAEIIIDGVPMQKVYCGDKLVWQKLAGNGGIIKLGLLYNHYAIRDARGIAAPGFHVPTAITEYNTIIQYYDPGGTYTANTAGGELKEVGLEWWANPNNYATNESGFCARGSGSRTTSGAFTEEKSVFRVWGIEPLGASGRSYSITNIGDMLGFGNINATSGCSIRLVKDATTLAHGETGTYIGNDGKEYKTICIDGLEILSENLAETQFANGDPIPEVIDGSAWAALETAGMCALYNDWSNV